MLQKPKKTYSRRKKCKSKRDSTLCVNILQESSQNSKLEDDQTLPDDIWMDSFDKMKEISLPSLKKTRTTRRYRTLRNSKKPVDRYQNIPVPDITISSENRSAAVSIVSTPVINLPKNSLTCNISPIITNQRLFSASDFFDSNGNPLLVFQYSSSSFQSEADHFDENPTVGEKNRHRKFIRKKHPRGSQNLKSLEKEPKPKRNPVNKKIEKIKAICKKVKNITTRKKSSPKNNDEEKINMETVTKALSKSKKQNAKVSVAKGKNNDQCEGDLNKANRLETIVLGGSISSVSDTSMEFINVGNDFVENNIANEGNKNCDSATNSAAANAQMDKESRVDVLDVLSVKDSNIDRAINQEVIIPTKKLKSHKIENQICNKSRRSIPNKKQLCEEPQKSANKNEKQENVSFNINLRSRCKELSRKLGRNVHRDSKSGNSNKIRKSARILGKDLTFTDVKHVDAIPDQNSGRLQLEKEVLPEARSPNLQIGSERMRSKRNTSETNIVLGEQSKKSKYKSSLHLLASVDSGDEIVPPSPQTLTNKSRLRRRDYVRNLFNNFNHQSKKSSVSEQSKKLPYFQHENRNESTVSGNPSNDESYCILRKSTSNKIRLRHRPSTSSIKILSSSITPLNIATEEHLNCSRAQDVEVRFEVELDKSSGLDMSALIDNCQSKNNSKGFDSNTVNKNELQQSVDSDSTIINFSLPSIFTDSSLQDKENSPVNASAVNNSGNISNLVTNLERSSLNNTNECRKSKSVSDPEKSNELTNSVSRRSAKTRNASKYSGSSIFGMILSSRSSVQNNNESVDAQSKNNTEHGNENFSKSIYVTPPKNQLPGRTSFVTRRSKRISDKITSKKNTEVNSALKFIENLPEVHLIENSRIGSMEGDSESLQKSIDLNGRKKSVAVKNNSSDNAKSNGKRSSDNNVAVLRNAEIDLNNITEISAISNDLEIIDEEWLNQGTVNAQSKSLDDSIDRDNFISMINQKTVSFNKTTKQPGYDSSLNKHPSEHSQNMPDKSLKGIPSSCLAPSNAPVLEVVGEDLECSQAINRQDEMPALVLPPGKWRKSLSIWRKTASMILKNTSASLQQQPSTNQSSMLISFNQEISFVLSNNQSHGCNSKTKLETSKSVHPIPEVVLEESVDRSNSFALLLEKTDDELPNQSKSQKNTPNSNEQPSNERIQRYQHQLSIPLYRQPSLYRRRRTSSFIEHSARILPYDCELRSQLSHCDVVLRRCGQSEPLQFADEYSETKLHQCRKIGEGVYGEVFMNKSERGETVVLKIIPIEGSIEVNGEPQKKFDKILSEIVIAMELSRLHNDKEFMTSGFVEVKQVRCVKGRYPDHLIELWELYRENYGTENDHPEIFPEDQLYIVLELANGGQDLEAFTFQNALQSYSAFVQTALTLAVAELKFQFEHRDLHWGNILLAPTDEKEVEFRINGKEIKIPTHGVKATIIDFTLSRMVFDGCCLYNDLANDNELFSATGDYQFDIYRLMKKRLDDEWERFEPYTNILWLHYTLDKMISGARYRCSKSKKHRSAIQDMMQLRDELLDYKSASNYVECLN